MNKIESFNVNHNLLVPGIYLSRNDKNIVTFDLRFKYPNTDDLLTNSEMHSIEHVIATLLRNSVARDAIIYFGPMGCQTGFYFLFDSNILTLESAIELIKYVFNAAAFFDGDMPGNSPIECGNYKNLNMEFVHEQCKFYSNIIRDWNVDKLVYPK